LMRAEDRVRVGVLPADEAIELGGGGDRHDGILPSRPRRCSTAKSGEGCGRANLEGSPGRPVMDHR
jgi:hypothetical protein